MGDSNRGAGASMSRCRDVDLSRIKSRSKLTTMMTWIGSRKKRKTKQDAKKANKEWETRWTLNQLYFPLSRPFPFLSFRVAWLCSYYAFPAKCKVQPVDPCCCCLCPFGRAVASASLALSSLCAAPYQSAVRRRYFFETGQAAPFFRLFLLLHGVKGILTARTDSYCDGSTPVPRTERCLLTLSSLLSKTAPNRQLKSLCAVQAASPPAVGKGLMIGWECGRWILPQSDRYIHLNE